MDEEATQPGKRSPKPSFAVRHEEPQANDPYVVATQLVTDPRRLGHHNSGLNDEDLTDIFCILHPASMTACQAIAQIADTAPEHTIRTTGVELKIRGNDANIKLPGKSELPAHGVGSRNIALRLSADLKEPLAGYCFGRNPQRCDFIFGNTEVIKRISNVHFRIYITEHGVIMLEDQSTNGTYVEKVLLWAKEKENGSQHRHMLQQGSLITILMTPPEEDIKFVVRIPQREGEFEALYDQNLQRYFDRLTRIGMERHLTRAKPTTKRTAAACEGKNGRAHDGPPDIFGLKTQRTLSTDKLDMARRVKEWRGGTKYNKIGTIGKGAFATVYKIATKYDGTPYAAKELEKRRFMKNGILDQKVDMEMQIMRKISHPHIVRYIEHFDWDDYLYLIMEFVPGGDLGALIVEEQRLTEDIVKVMASQLLSALQYLNEMGVTHRDVKPDNILIQSHHPFVVKLTDFGLSKKIDHDETFLRTFCGTLLYCAPEVHTEYRDYDDHGNRKPRSRDKRTLPKQRYNQAVDLWSLGAVLFYALCGNPPYPAQSGTGAAEILNSIMTLPLDIRPLQRVNVSEAGIRLIRSMLQVNPDRRPTIDALKQSPWFAADSVATSLDEDDEIDILNEADSAIIEEGASLLSIGADNECKDYESQSQETEFAHTVESQLEQIPTSIRTSGSLFSGDSFAFLQTPVGNARLFGEVDPSALGSSGVIPEENLNLPISQSGHLESSSQFDQNSEAMDTQYEPSILSVLREDHGMSHRHGLSSGTGANFIAEIPEPLESSSAAPSLLGAESLVGQLQMSSPSERAARHFPSPSPPENRGCGTSLRRPRDDTIFAEDSRPAAKRVRSGREIEVAIPKSIFWDERDRSTWHEDYPDMMLSEYNKVVELAKAQGEKFVRGEKIFEEYVGSYQKPPREQPEVQIRAKSEPLVEQGRRAMMIRDGRKLSDLAAESEPPRSPGVFIGRDNPKSVAATNHIPRLEATKSPKDMTFKSPRRILAKFNSASDSMLPGISLTITEHFTSWGRGPGNTVIYPKASENRIPKTAFKLLLWKRGVSKTGSVVPPDNMSFWISTKASMGIHINGILLRSHNCREPATASEEWGELRHGDEVKVWTQEPYHKHSIRLRFDCFFGHSQTPRGPDAATFTVAPREVSDELDEYCLQVQADMTTQGASNSTSNHESRKTRIATSEGTIHRSSNLSGKFLGGLQ